MGWGEANNQSLLDAPGRKVMGGKPARTAWGKEGPLLVAGGGKTPFNKKDNPLPEFARGEGRGRLLLPARKRENFEGRRIGGTLGGSCCFS